MTDKQNLGEFEQLILLAILRLVDTGAYGVPIRKLIADSTERDPAPGAIYTTLDRLEGKGYITSSVGEATAERGGRAKRYYKVTPSGAKALRRTQREFQRLAQGLNLFGGSHA